MQGESAVRKKVPWWLSFGALMAVAMGVLVVVTVRGQEQVELGQHYLDAIRKNDVARAEALSDGEARAALAASANGPWDASSVRAVAIVRESIANETSSNVTTSWDVRCVRATSTAKDGTRTALYMRIEKLDPGWRVTGLTTRESEYGVCDSG